jgi:hypothetical protein
MEVLLRLLLKSLSIITLIVFIVSVATLIVTLRKPRRVSIPSIILTVIISLTTLAAFSFLTRYRPPAWSWLLLVAAGIAIGIVWARTTKVFARGGHVMSQNSTLYLGVWGGIFAINQLVTIVTNRPPHVAMALLIAGTAIVWGTNGSIVHRYIRVKADCRLGRGAAEPTVSGTCPRCGAASRQGAAFCGKCGVKL